MKFRFLLIIAALIMVRPSLAQNQTYAFKVLINKGSNEAKTGTTWKPVTTGLSLNKGDELKVSQNAVVSLMHSTGKPLELKEPGNYPVSVLEEKVKGNSSGVVTRFTDFILSKSEDTKKNRLTATGAVHRGPVEPILIQAPVNKKIDLYSRSFTLNWIPVNTPGPYVVTVSNYSEDVLGTYEVNGTSLALDLNGIEFQNDLNFMIKISSKATPDKHSEPLAVAMVNHEKASRVRKDMESVSAQVEPGTMTYYILAASMFEENNLILDAQTTYEQAIKAFPEVGDFKTFLEEFRLRNLMVRLPAK